MEFFRSKPLIEQVTDGSLDSKLFGAGLKQHMNEQEYRRTRFSSELGIRYKDLVDQLINGNFQVDAVLQERTKNNKGHLVVAIRREDTDVYHQKYVVMVLNESGSTLFPPSETIIDYIADKLRDGNFVGNMHFMTPDLRTAYSSMVKRQADMSKVFGLEKDRIGQKTKDVVIEIAKHLKVPTK